MMEKSCPDTIRENLRRILFEIQEAALKANRDPGEVSLMAVAKTVPARLVNSAIAAGVRLIGENKAQELCEKYEEYDKNGVSIHFIGHLQTNKTRLVVDKADMIHSLDSLRLAQAIDLQAGKLGRVMDVLLEVNIGNEDSKFGVKPHEVEEFAWKISSLSHIRLCGLMTIPPLCMEKAQNERFFYTMQQLLVDIRGKKIDNVRMDILSMGMSDDFPEAVKHGSNIVRIGTALFGVR